ncbi:MAG: hypothetical protein KDB01_04800 [Planctomycetaceae bacterium]|nr:hypothetical protein [Planctomycetaceae bacterium]
MSKFDVTLPPAHRRGLIAIEITRRDFRLGKNLTVSVFEACPRPVDGPFSLGLIAGIDLMVINFAGSTGKQIA